MPHPLHKGSNQKGSGEGGRDAIRAYSGRREADVLMSSPTGAYTDNEDKPSLSRFPFVQLPDPTQTRWTRGATLDRPQKILC
jgi:hypothetical protein